MNEKKLNTEPEATRERPEPKLSDRQILSRLVLLLAVALLLLLAGCSSGDASRRIENAADDLSRIALFECDPAAGTPPPGMTLTCRTSEERRADAVALRSHRNP